MNSLSFSDCFTSVPVCKEKETEFYPTTNEVNTQATLVKAAKYEVVAGKVLLFVSGMYGLNLAAARGTDSASSNRIEHLVCCQATC